MDKSYSKEYASDVDFAVFNLLVTGGHFVTGVPAPLGIALRVDYAAAVLLSIRHQC
jgi:hypothetical protein